MDDTLFLMNKSNVKSFLIKVPVVIETPNVFLKNLIFTVDLFENKKGHFLDLMIHKNTVDIFDRHTHTVPYVNCNKCMLQKMKMFSVKSLYR